MVILALLLGHGFPKSLSSCNDKVLVRLDTVGVTLGEKRVITQPIIPVDYIFLLNSLKRNVGSLFSANVTMAALLRVPRQLAIESRRLLRHVVYRL
jgi:hypothetical protein